MNSDAMSYSGAAQADAGSLRAPGVMAPPAATETATEPIATGADHDAMRAYQIRKQLIIHDFIKQQRTRFIRTEIAHWKRCVLDILLQCSISYAMFMLFHCFRNLTKRLCNCMVAFFLNMLFSFL